MKKRETEFIEIMYGKAIENGLLQSSNYTDKFKQELQNYGQLLENTMINSTPTMINSKGEQIKNGKEL